MAQLITKFVRSESLREALMDPEVELFFSNTYIPEGQEKPPVKLILLKGDEAVQHFLD